MKTTQNNKLAFSKNSLVELNDNQMYNVNGGTSSLMWPTTTIWITLADQVAN